VTRSVNPNVGPPREPRRCIPKKDAEKEEAPGEGRGKKNKSHPEKEGTRNRNNKLQKKTIMIMEMLLVTAIVAPILLQR
jgi:hypothetical protein